MKSIRLSLVAPVRLIFLLLVAWGGSLKADRPAAGYEPPIEAASDEAVEAISGFEVGEPFQIELFAAEPLLANPVQLYVDGRGRVFIAETYRQGDEGGVVDNRDHMYWLEEDLAAERVEDRAAMVRRRRPEMVEEWTTHHDIVRLLEDTTGDGKADQSRIFADGFNDLLDGTGAGVISRGGKVWYTNIPHLWLLEDTDGDGYSDRRESLSYGYGVKVALRGHDLHGLVFGPDGKLYFSLGDRGYNVITREGIQLKASEEGAVFRCNPDGTNLEIFATGLRNPQGLAFDEFGNLFTGDNNSDGGDRARWVYVVEGGDSGWRMPYQTLDDRGPFMREGLWKPRFEGQPAWHIPPIANLGDGPSGLAVNPGTGMPAEYDGYFFLADFRASAPRSGVWAIANEPAGAGFALADHHRFIWNILATDVAFGPDGALYIADWVEGWSGVNRGRIYRLSDPALAQSPEAREVEEFLQEGLEGRSIEELLEMIGHPNQRMRQEAQFELAQRGGEALAPLARAARSGERRARIHAIWALWQLADAQRGEALDPLLPLLDDPDPEIRAQAAKVLGDKAALRATSRLIEMLADPEARPAYFAAIGLGRLRAVEATEGVVELLRRNNDEDLYLRHAAAMALTGIGRDNAAPLLAYVADADPSVRLGVLLALRRLDHPQVALFLNDSDESLVAEAAAAINDDTLIEAAQPNLAATMRRQDLRDERVLRRVINANFRMGGHLQAQEVAAFAARSDAPVAMRVEALHALGDWHQPGDRDRVTGSWRPLTGRPKEWPITALDAVLDAVLGPEAPARVRTAAIEAISRYEMKGRAADLLKIVRAAEEKAELRRISLNALGNLGDGPELREGVEIAIASDSEEFRREAYGILGRLDAAVGVSVLEALIGSGSSAPEDKQKAITTLREMNSPEAEAVIAFWFGKLVDDEESVPPEIHLDLIEAAGQSESPPLQEQVRRFREGRENDVQAVRSELLYGGDVALGKELVFNHQAASCQRCHVIDGRGSSDVGPDLSDIGARMNRRELLESLVDPSAIVAEGYGAATFELAGGGSVSGSIARQDEESITVTTLSGEVKKLERAQIVSRKGPVSAMPPMGILLKDEELRAIVAYLASLRN